MTTTSERPGARPRGSSTDFYDEPSGWLMFAGIMLMATGVMRFFDSLWAFAFKGAVPNNLQNAIFGHSLDTYAWIWLVVSVVLFFSGLGVVVARSQPSRWIGVVAGSLGAISAVSWMPYYPVWSLLYVGTGVAVVYGLVAHGQRVD